MFQRIVAKTYVGGYSLKRMRIQTEADINKAKQAFKQEYQRGIANFDWMLAELRRQATEQNASPSPNAMTSEKSSATLIWTIKDATKVILDRMPSGTQFLRREVFLAAKELTTRIPVTAGAVNNALDKFESEGIVQTTKAGGGASPGIYTKI